MHLTFRRSVIAAIALTGACAAAAVAAPTGQSGDPGAAQPARSPSNPAPDRATLVEQRIAGLHAKLQITPAQQTQWDQFSQVMRDNAQNMDATFKSRIKAMPSITAPENMQSYAQVAMSHAQDVQKLVPVFQALYDTMSDNQKRIADKIFREDAHHSRRR